MQFSVYCLKESLNITRCKAFQRCQWGFRSYRIWCCEIGCLPMFWNSIMISSTTEDKTLDNVFRFMWTNTMLKVHSCRCKCSFVWIIYLPNRAFISNSWQLNRFWTSNFLENCLSRGQCRVTLPKPKSSNNCPLLVLLIQPLLVLLMQPLLVLLIQPLLVLLMQPLLVLLIQPLLVLLIQIFSTSYL